MQTVYKRFSIFAASALLLVVLIVNAVVTRRELGHQVESQAHVARSVEVLYELSETESLMKDAETGQRGYLYTGDAQYLAPYDAARTQVAGHVDVLASLTAGDSTEQERVPELRALVERKLDELGRTIALYDAGKADEAKALVLSDVGLRDMNRIRQLVVEMEGTERTLEAERTERYRTSIHKTVLSIYGTSLLAALGLMLLTYYILRQIALRERHAADLRAREEWFRVTLTSIGDGVVATDPGGHVTFLNPIAEQLTGTTLAAIKGRVIHEVFPIYNEHTGKAAENPVARVLAEGIVIGMANHTVLKSVNGTLIPIEDSAAPIRDDGGRLLGVILVFRDVSHERKSEEVLRKTEKLASAARLSATVAHEINNPLEAVFNLVFVSKMNPATPPEVMSHLQLAEQELERVSHIVKQTLGFYRDSSVPQKVDLARLLDSIIGLYGHKLRAKEIAVQRDYAECPPVVGVPGELKQALSNLISNAADAVSAHGSIRVGLKCIEDGVKQSVEVTVEDDGPGIPAEHHERIFEPFFTTKQDVGTGLGLWVTKGIVDRHGGSISVYPDSDEDARRGAAFAVMLPVNGALEANGQTAV
jgi:PAS domain S-box-containing protein